MIDERRGNRNAGRNTQGFLAILFKHKAKILVVFFSVVVTVTVCLFRPSYDLRGEIERAGQIRKGIPLPPGSGR